MSHTYQAALAAPTRPFPLCLIGVGLDLSLVSDCQLPIVWAVLGWVDSGAIIYTFLILADILVTSLIVNLTIFRLRVKIPELVTVAVVLGVALVVAVKFVPTVLYLLVFGRRPLPMFVIDCPFVSGDSNFCSRASGTAGSARLPCVGSFPSSY